MKYEVHLNGTVIDDVSFNESAVTITGLQPGAFYVVRVGVVFNEFSSKSPAIRFRTKSAESGDFFNVAADGHETDSDAAHSSVPRVRPYRALKDFTPASPTTSAPMAREASSGLSTGRNNSRRPSPAALGLENYQDPPPNEVEQTDGAETIQQLTEKLDGIRREIEEAEKQAKEEEEEELRQKEELIKERDALKSEANEREKASRNLKREVNALERQNTAAQNERAKQERLLQQKKQERQKVKDDMVRWERGAEEMKADVERLHRDKASYLERLAQEKKTLQNKQTEETARTRALDDEIKEKTAEIKKLERAMKDISPNGSEAEPNLVQQFQNEAEEERKWQMLRHGLQQQYQMAYTKVDNAKRFHAEQLRYLESLRAERRRQDEMVSQYSSPMMLERVPRRRDSRRSRASVSDSPRLGAFQVPFSGAGAGAGAGGFNSSPFLNIHNGMTLAGPTDEVTMSDEERERLTGGAAMSPSAGAGLIPADLFSGDGDTRTATEYVKPLPGLGSLPGLPGLPGPQAQHEYPGPGPASPAASSSRSPSVFASPQISQPNLILGSPDNAIDPDRRSIRSTRSNRAPSGGTGSRFSGMFGIKQRHKNVSEEGPPLGKASSMPRQDQGIPGLDSASRKRNSSISGTVLGAVDGGELDGSSEASAAAAPGRRAFGSFFSKDKTGGWPSTFTAFGRRPASPRPGSTHSNELPRPSIEGSRWGAEAWPSGDASAGARGSPLAFGSGWNAPPQQSRLFGSRHPSRRPSVQYGASGPPEDIMEDDDSDALDPNQTTHLAPIGTKPPPGSKKPERERESGARLNPNAKDFKSFFGMKFGGKDKSKDAGESSEKQDGSTPLLSTSTTSHLAPGIDNEDGSPPDSRKSRDTRSMTTADNSSLAESGRNSPDLFRTPSYSNSDVAAPSPSLQTKESFMQKITRKSSSSKFSLPTFKREKSRLETAVPSNTSTPTQAGAEEEEGMSESLGSLRDVRESKDGGPGGSGKGPTRSWSSASKIGKGLKKGNESTSLSDRISTASGTEDGDDEEEG